MKKISILLFVVCPLTAASQTFQKKYGGTANDFATDIVLTSDGGTIAVGDTYSFGVQSSDMYFVKTDAGGNVQWSKSLGSSEYDHANAVIQTTDGGYAVAGSSGGNNSRIALVKLTSAGDVQWIKYFTVNTRQSAAALVQTPDGGYAVAGQVSTYGNGSWGSVIRTDSTGTLVWSKLIFNRDFYPEIRDITLTKDGGFALAGHFPTPSYYDMFLVKLSAAGTFQWARSIGGSSTEIPSFVKQTSDNGYLMGGLSFSYGTPFSQEMFVVKTSVDGTYQWSKNIGTVRSETVEDAFEIPGGFVLTGSTDSSAGYIRKPMLVRLKSNGKFIGAKILNVPENVAPSAATVYTNTGFYVAGQTGSLYDNSQKLYIAKFNAAGNTCNTFSSFGTSKDTGTLTVQTVPVTNANTFVANGTELTVTRNSTVSDLCTVAAAFAAGGNDAFSAAAQMHTATRLTPNPVAAVAQLQYQSAENRSISVCIFSAEGKILSNHKFNAVKGNNQFTIPVNNLHSGIYILQIISGREQSTLKFVKQ